MPAHHPVPSSAAGHLRKLNREHEELVDEVCARVSARLDLAVGALKTLVKKRDPDLWRRIAPPARRA